MKIPDIRNKNKTMRVLVLAGGSDQVALIKELQKRGHHVILLDYLPNPPAKQLVDKHIQESTLDINMVKKCAIEENIDMVCTACTDQALLTVAKVSEDLKLPCYISYDKALSVTNKYYMKRCMMKENIPTAKYHTFQNINDLNVLKDLTFPLVIKPADCNSSKGVVKVNDMEECRDALANALLLSRSSTAIVEEFKTGKEISADFYIDGDRPLLLSATASTKINGRNGFTINGSEYPAISKVQEKNLIEIADKISKGFGLKNTPLLVQLILDDGYFYVIEFSARMGGGSKYYLIQEISGLNIMSAYTDLILGVKPKIDISHNPNRIRMIYVYCRPGKVDKILGLEKLKEEDIIKEWFLYKNLGSLIEKAETSSDRLLGLLVVSETEDQMHHKISQINKNLSVIDENGEDMMLHDLIEN